MQPRVEATFRPAEISDLAALVIMYESLYDEDGIAFNRETLRERIGYYLHDTRSRIWLCEIGPTCVGIVSASSTYGVEYGWAIELEDLFVKSSHRGLGLARQMIGLVVAWAESIDCREVFLFITPEAEVTQSLTKFYERQGFIKTDRIAMFRSL